MAKFIVKPYMDRSRDSIGLTEYGFDAFPGSKTYIEVPLLFGKYLTGFDVNAFYLEKMDDKAKEKEKKAISAKVKDLNSKYPSFKVDDVLVEDDGQGNIKANPFYRDMVLELQSDMTIFNTDNPEDLVKIEIIKINATHNPEFEVAPDLTTAKESNKKYKYYIVNADRDVEQEVSKRRELNKAVSILDELSSNEKEKFLLVIKYLLPANKAYSTESDNRLYKRADDYINGIVEGEKVKGGELFHKNFIKASETAREELYIKVLIKYAIMTNIIRLNSKTKEFEYVKTSQELGKTMEDVYRYLSDVKNIDLLNNIKTDTLAETKIV